MAEGDRLEDSSRDVIRARLGLEPVGVQIERERSKKLTPEERKAELARLVESLKVEGGNQTPLVSGDGQSSSPWEEVVGPATYQQTYGRKK